MMINQTKENMTLNNIFYVIKLQKINSNIDISTLFRVKAATAFSVS